MFVEKGGRYVKKNHKYCGVILITFSFVCCDNGKELREYKENAKQTIKDYINMLVETDYSEESWEEILQIAATGENKIDAANKKSDVDTVLENIKDEILAVKKDEKLSLELENRIKQDYFRDYGNELYFGDNYINKFYGLYNGAAVFFIATENEAVKTITIAGVEFSWDYDWNILVWVDGSFYNLEDIQNIIDLNILTQDDIVRIGAIHADRNNEI